MQSGTYAGYTFINSEKAFTQSECYKIQRIPAQSCEYTILGIISTCLAFPLTHFDLFSLFYRLTKFFTYKSRQTG